MLYDVKTPQEYLKGLEDDWRKPKLEAIRKMILDYAPDIEEGIMYKMLSYGKGEDILFQLNAQMNYVSLYVGDIKKISQSEEMLSDFDYGKGCIRVKKSLDLEKTQLKQFIHQTIDHWEKRWRYCLLENIY